MAERPTSLSTPQARVAAQRRTEGGAGSSLPMPSRRTISETRALVRDTPQSVRRTPSSLGGSGGPLGAYRSLSRSGSTPLRSSTSLGKRTISSTDLLEPGALATPKDTPKRTLVSSGLATGPRARPLAELPEAPQRSEAYELTMLRTEYDRRIEEEQRAHRHLESQIRSQARELEVLKCQRVEVLNEWEAERAAQRQKHEDWHASKHALEQELAALRSETLQLREAKNEALAQVSEVQSTSHAEQSQLRTDLIAAQSDAAQAQEQAQHWQQVSERLRAENAELEQAKERGVRSAPVDDEEVTMLKEQLSQQIAAVHRLETSQTRLTTENARLAEACQGAEILRETNRSLEAKAKRMDTLHDDLLKKDQELGTLRAEQEEWSHILRQGVQTDEHAAFVAAANVEADVPKVELPASLTHETLAPYVSTLRGTIMGLSARIEGLTHSVEQLRSSNVTLERQARQGSENESNLTRELSEKATALMRVQRQHDVQADELRRCKELLATFETEAQGSETYDQVQSQRVADLETRFASAQQECMSLASRLEDAERAAADAAERAQTAVAPAATSDADRRALGEARTALASLEARYAELEAQAQALGAENDQLYTRVGRGEFDQTRVKCLTLQDNPVSRDYAIRTASLDALRKENEGLLRQIESLHEQLKAAGASSQPAGDSGTVVPLQTVENLKRELAQLEETIQLKDKGMLRLKQVFTAKANEFREAVQSLFGYKLRFLENGKVKLTSAYARGARVTTLVFRSEEGNVGEMKLQGEAADGLANVAHLRDYWLSDGIRHSVPCFLAALNLELYENTTQAIRGAFGAPEEE